MTTTPWGNADELRTRRLPPGPANSPDVVARNQRERLFAAMVAVVAEQSYETTRVEDVVALSGVSRSGFYQHFANKRECFLATFDAIAELAVERLAEAAGEPGGPAMGAGEPDGGARGRGRAAANGQPADWQDRLAAGLQALVDAIGEQPAAARLLLVEAYAAGPEAAERLDALGARVERFVKRTLADSPERAGMPADMIRGLVGGVRRVLESRVRRGDHDELPALAPQLIEWVSGYRTPPERLRRSRASAPAGGVPPLEADDATARLTGAIGEVAARNGYPGVTIAEVADVARASLTTFYANFATKEDAFGAAVERAGELCLAASRHACAEAGSWPEGVRDGVDAAFGVLAAEPALAAVATTETDAAGPPALERRDRTLGDFQRLLHERADAPPASSAPAVTGEATAGALLALIGEQVRRGRAERLRELSPVAAYLTLARLIDAAEACAVVNATPARRGR